MARLPSLPALARAGLALILLAFALSASASPSNKWRLEFSGGADSDGTIVIEVTPTGGSPLRASIDIDDGTGENAVARAVTKGLKEQLPEDAFHVERDDGEDVLVKRRRGAAEFEIEVVSNSVKGVRIDRDRE